MIWCNTWNVWAIPYKSGCGMCPDCMKSMEEEE